MSRLYWNKSTVWFVLWLMKIKSSVYRGGRAVFQLGKEGGLISISLSPFPPLYKKISTPLPPGSAVPGVLKIMYGDCTLLLMQKQCSLFVHSSVNNIIIEEFFFYPIKLLSISWDQVDNVTSCSRSKGCIAQLQSLLIMKDLVWSSYKEYYIHNKWTGKRSFCCRRLMWFSGRKAFL